MELVSVIVPTYNRFGFLLNTLRSIKNQTYPTIEIIVVNDCSTDKEYYTYDWEANGIRIVHLQRNTVEQFGFACAGFVRNKGIEISNGKYIAFCDDDDSWLPMKLELQIEHMKKTNCKMSSTEGYIGNGPYDTQKFYKLYNREHFFNVLLHIFRNKHSTLLNNGFPSIWDLNFLRIHNCMITSSVVVEKEILNKVSNFRQVANKIEDYDCWLRCLQFTNSVYVDIPCFYYDDNHGNGQNY